MLLPNGKRTSEATAFNGSLAELAQALFLISQKVDGAPTGYDSRKIEGALLLQWLSTALSSSWVYLSQTDFAGYYGASDLGQFTGKTLHVHTRIDQDQVAMPDVLVTCLGPQLVAEEDAYTFEVTQNGDVLTPINYNPATDEATLRAGGAISFADLNYTQTEHTKLAGIAANATANAKATAAEVVAGTNDDKYLTPLSYAGSTMDLAAYLQDIPATTIGHITNAANWNSANQYIGPAIPAGLTLKVHLFYPVDPAVAAYRYEFWPSNKVIRQKVTN